MTEDEALPWNACADLCEEKGFPEQAHLLRRVANPGLGPLRLADYQLEPTGDEIIAVEAGEAIARGQLVYLGADGRVVPESSRRKAMLSEGPQLTDLGRALRDIAEGEVVDHDPARRTFG